MFAYSPRSLRSPAPRPRVNLDSCRVQSELETSHADAVFASIEALPEVDRDVIVLHFLRGLSEDVIAARLGLDPWIVRRRLHDAIQRLRGDATQVPSNP